MQNCKPTCTWLYIHTRNKKEATGKCRQQRAEYLPAVSRAAGLCTTQPCKAPFTYLTCQDVQKSARTNGYIPVFNSTPKSAPQQLIKTANVKNLPLGTSWQHVLLEYRPD